MTSGRILEKGNVAAVKGALLAGCRSFYGYPITPASEIAEAAARLFPEVGATFLQAESEIAAINMVYGAAAAGERTMTASSSPGVSLMQEGLSYAAGAELPLVLVDVMRGGPGLGNIAPEQSDYNQIIKGGGHGSYRLITLAPASVQEMCTLTMTAFDLADRYRNPVCVLADGCIGQMMEPVHYPDEVAAVCERPWAVGPSHPRTNLVSSILLDPHELERHVLSLERKYAAAAEEVRFDEYWLEGAEVILIGYGIVGRLLRSATEMLRSRGRAVGMLRPITLWPFPKSEIRSLATRARALFVVELSLGQMVDDVRLAAGDSSPVGFYGRSGGVIPEVEEICEAVEDFAREVG